MPIPKLPVERSLILSTLFDLKMISAALEEPKNWVGEPGKVPDNVVDAEDDCPIELKLKTEQMIEHKMIESFL